MDWFATELKQSEIFGVQLVAKTLRRVPQDTAQVSVYFH